MHLSTRKNNLRITELTLFSMLGGIMYLSKSLMQILPNIHLIAVFILSITLTYRKKALIPVYIYIFLDGLLSGFSAWWIPYLYIWLPLFGAGMLVGSSKMNYKNKAVLSMIFCGLHGISFGTLYAPMQALMYGMNMKAMLTWIIAGLPFDIIHGASNLIAGFLIMPLHYLMKRFNI